jgi:DNA-binding transcriptional MerR regulator
MDGLTRSQLAARAQVNLETIRFYEGEGLLPIAPRTASGYRKFSESTVERLAFVKRAKALGFSWEEIRELLHLQSEHVGACAEVRDLLRAKVSVVREKRAQLERLEAQLTAALHKCDKALKQQVKSAETCPILHQMADARPQSDELKTNGTRLVAARGRERFRRKAKPEEKKAGEG